MHLQRLFRLKEASMQISVAILVQGVVKRKGIAFIKDRQVAPTHISGLGLY
jgi:hypothetical protein